MVDPDRTAVNEAVVQPSADAALDSRRDRLIAILLAVTVIIAVGGGVWNYALQRNTHDLHGQVGDLTGQVSTLSGRVQTYATAAQQLAGQLRGLGATPVVQPPAPAANQQGQAATQQEIDNAVFGYFAVHPPGATPAMVAVNVASYLTAHPPKPGPPPTPAMIATAASDYIAAHANAFQGQPGHDGANGQDGQNATDDQVVAAVGAYCDAHNECQGQQGDPGSSITDLQFQRDDSGACDSVATIHDPATGQDTTVAHPAGDAACPPVSTPPTTTASSPPSGLLGLPGGRR